VIAPDARFRVERIQGERFDVRPGAWTRHGDVPQDANTGAIVVNAANLLYQYVPVAAGATYMYVVEVRCHASSAEVRLQVIWTLRGGGTRVDARSAACAPDWVEERELVVAPRDAIAAIVYATAHGAEPVEMRRVSFLSPNRT